MRAFKENIETVLILIYSNAINVLILVLVKLANRRTIANYGPFAANGHMVKKKPATFMINGG